MRFLAALLLVTPLVASAQYERGGPRGYEEPDRGYGGRRSPLYFAIAAGVPTGSFNDRGDPWTYAEWNEGATRTLAASTFDVQIGFSLGQRALVGFDYSLHGIWSNDFGYSTAVWNQNADGVLTLFPQGEGFFLRAGGGLSWLSLVDTYAGDTAPQTSSGVNVTVGLGYAFWLGRTLNLTGALDAWFQRYSGQYPDISSAVTAAATIGLAWY